MRAMYCYYNKSLDEMMQRRDKVNITLSVLERLDFGVSDDDTTWEISACSALITSLTFSANFYEIPIFEN